MWFCGDSVYVSDYIILHNPFTLVHVSDYVILHNPFTLVHMHWASLCCFLVQQVCYMCIHDACDVYITFHLVHVAAMMDYS